MGAQKPTLLRTSLVVQWLRIHLGIQGTQVQSLVEKIRSPDYGERSGALVSHLESPNDAMKIPHAATKTRRSRENKK